jgi:hypothetical protein
MSLQTVTLTWNLSDFLQVAVGKAMITVSPDTQVAIQSAGQIVVPQPRSRTFTGGSGSLSGIVATDNTGMSPATFNYLISVINAVDTRQVLVPQFSTPIAFANGATQDLADILAAVL